MAYNKEMSTLRTLLYHGYDILYFLSCDTLCNAYTWHGIC